MRNGFFLPKVGAGGKKMDVTKINDRITVVVAVFFILTVVVVI